MIRNLVLAAVTATLLLTTPAPAHAAANRVTYDDCLQTWTAPNSATADTCRDRGWTIGSRFVVGPRLTLRYYDLPTCQNPDGSGGRSSCGWNIRSGLGSADTWLVIKNRKFNPDYVNVVVPKSLFEPSTDRTPVCQYEDGSGQARCVWDARHNGNGVGRSYVVVHGGRDDAKIRFVSHRRAHRLATTNR